MIGHRLAAQTIPIYVCVLTTVCEKRVGPCAVRALALAHALWHRRERRMMSDNDY
jgi:hypothetical protein